MTVEKTLSDGTLTYSLSGWLDTTTSPQFAAATEEMGEFTSLVLDFGGLEYISSAGLRQVAACARKAREHGAAFSVVNAGTEVMSVFRLTGLDKKFDITPKA